MRGEQGTESTSLMVSSAEDVSDRRDRSSGGRLPDTVRTRGEPQCSSQPLSTVWADLWNEPGQNPEQLTRQQALLPSPNRSPLTSSLLVPSSWALSEGDRSKGVRPMLLQILLHRWEWKNKAMPLTPGGETQPRHFTPLSPRCPQRSPTQVPVSKVGPLLRVDLRVGVQVPHPLDVHHDQLVARPLEGEVAEGLAGTRRQSTPRPRVDARAGRTQLTWGVSRMLSSRTKPELELYLMYLPSM